MTKLNNETALETLDGVIQMLKTPVGKLEGDFKIVEPLERVRENLEKQCNRKGGNNGRECL